MQVPAYPLSPPYFVAFGSLMYFETPFAAAVTDSPAVQKSHRPANPAPLVAIAPSEHHVVLPIVHQVPAAAPGEAYLWEADSLPWAAPDADRT